MAGMGFAFFGFPGGMMGDFDFTPGFFPFVFPMGVFLAVTVSFAVWSWITVQNIQAGKYANVQTATLVLGVFGIFFAWLIGGIFLLLAHGKIEDVIRSTQVAKVLPPTQPQGRICTNCGRPVAWEAKFCEHCGKELAG